ncbi:MAG: ABC transporter permease [Chloroflexi bacterium]|nr:ABC transporter permease [Chloroflexota bacterium]
MSVKAHALQQALTAEDQELLRKLAAERRRAARTRLLDRIVLIVVLLAIWEGIVRVGWVHPFFISQPSRIFADLGKLILTGYIFPHLAITLYETLAGLLLGLVLGMATGLLSAISRRVGDAMEPILVAFNSMPRIAIAPLFLIWFGFGVESKIALAAMVVFFIIFFNVFSGVRSVEPALVNSIRTMGGTNRDVIRLVILPTTYAWVFAAMKTSISMALVSAVVGEFVGSTAGVGWIMTQASGVNDTTRLFSTMVVLAIVGALLFVAVRWIEDRMLRWRSSVEL